ncbi:MAG: general secretion pathway protein GspK [Opitutales bacterium]|nr:general secretion pathway protein GspK [Opitutales bacterium]
MITISTGQNRCSRASATRRTSSGSILVAVLGFILVASIMSFVIIERIVSDIAYRGLHDYRVDLKREGYSGLQAALAVLAEYKELDGTITGPQQGWHNLIARADYQPSGSYRVRARVTDETGKIPLNSQDPQLFIALLKHMELPQTEAEELADKLLDWIDADDLERNFGAEDDEYERRDPAYRAANRPIRDLSELALIDGFDETFFDENGTPNGLYDQLLQHTTLHHSGKINIHTADRFLLEAIAAMDNTNLSGLFDYMSGPDGELNTTDDLSLADAQQSPVPDSELFRNLTTDEVAVIQIEVAVSRGDVGSTLNALVNVKETDSIPTPDGNISLPFKVLAVRENQQF